MVYREFLDFSVLKGKIIKKIETDGEDKLIRFETIDVLGNEHNYRMYHSQDCCESVYVEDIVGDLNDLLDSPVLIAEERVNTPKEANLPVIDKSTLYTFYELATIKGSVTIRWCGSSNGYYSVGVDFEKDY